MSVDQNPPPPPVAIGTDWIAVAPVLASLANRRMPPPPVPAGRVRVKSAAGAVVMAVAVTAPIVRLQRNWLGHDAGPRAVSARRAWIKSPAAYEALSNVTPSTNPLAWAIVASACVLFPRSVAVTRNK